jgi:hypothetical protein
MKNIIVLLLLLFYPYQSNSFELYDTNYDTDEILSKTEFLPAIQYDGNLDLGLWILYNGKKNTGKMFIPIIDLSMKDDNWYKRLNILYNRRVYISTMKDDILLKEENVK